MKFTVEREAIEEAVAWVARALPARPVVPVLGGMLLRASGGWLTLSCFDYEVSARMRVPAEVTEPGSFLVPGRLLVEIVRSLPGYPVEFGDDPDGVFLTCGEAAYALAVVEPADYPELPDLPEVAGTADGGVLAAAIGQVTPAASKDDTLPMLTAVNVELDGATMTLAATDRYRLAVRDLDWTPAPAFREQGTGERGTGKQGRGEQGKMALLVSARTLADAARMMTSGTPVAIMLRTSDDGGAAAQGTAGAGTAGAGRGARSTAGPADTGGSAAAGDAMIGFETGERRLTTRLLAGEFVRYRSRFPEEFGCTADLPAGAFAEAVRRVALVAERGAPVQLSFAPGRVTVEAATPGRARARETVAADFTGDEPMISFSPHYLLDGVVAATATVPAMPGGHSDRQGERHSDRQGGDGADDQHVPEVARVRLQFTTASKPAVITPRANGGGHGDFRYLVVPQRVPR
jgi:DNA polymerase III subunit beta